MAARHSHTLGVNGINREDIAWAAGLFEGEGCFSWHTLHKSHSISAGINMVEEGTIRKFHSIVGVGKVTGPYSGDKPGWQPQWKWGTSNFEGTQAVGAMLWHWLGPRRKARFKEILKKFHSRPNAETYNVMKARRFAIERDVKEGKLKQSQIAELHGVSQASVSYIKSRGA